MAFSGQWKDQVRKRASLKMPPRADLHALKRDESTKKHSRKQ